jgi:hypothetical protein
MSVPDNNFLSFSILSLEDIEYLLVLDVDEVLSSVFEDLEPSRVGAPDLHLVSFSRVLDIPRLVVVSCSDSQGLLMEVPFLSSSTVSDLDDHVSVVDEVKVSALSHSGDNVEISFNNKTEVTVEFTLDWITYPFISIDNIELLVDLSVSVVGNDISVLSVLSTLDIEDLLSLIGNLKSSSIPHLPPSSIWCVHSESLRSTVR